MNKPVIRLIKKKDIPQLVGLCEEHAKFENADYDVEGKVQLLLKYFFKSVNDVICLVLEIDNNLIGYATIFKQFSTWDANFYFYMDCLYLKEEARGKGNGRMMMDAIKMYAIKEKCNLQWQTPKFNAEAILFYKRFGATHKAKERFFLNVIS